MNACFRFPLLAVTALLAMMVGCANEETVVLVPAEGYLTINGEPAANVLVQVMPDSLQGAKGPTSTGVTDESGWFKLATNDGRGGAVAGPCKIILSDLEEETRPQGAETAPSRIPATYSLVGPNSLSSEVKEDGEPIEIDLKV